MSIVRSALVVLVALAAAACGGDGNGGDSPSASSSAVVERPTSTAELAIARPTNGERVRGDRTELVVRLRGAELVDRTSTDLQPDEGHLHVTLDGTLVTMTSGLTQELTGLTAGEHLLQVEFVANDHAPFDPRVMAAVSFEAAT